MTPDTPDESRRCPICGECLTHDDDVWECVPCDYRTEDTDE